jgi:multiple sugar transport system substrate-binding protein
MKRLLSTVLILCMAVSVLAGCGQAKTPDATGVSVNNTAASTSGSPQKNINIRVTWWGNQQRNDGTVAVLNLYKENHPGLNFETEFTDWSNYWNKLATQSAAGSQPDIVQQDARYLKQYQEKGLLEVLTPYVEKGFINVADISKSVLENGTIDGKLYGITLGTNTYGMFYDKEITDKAGVTIKDQMTWDEFFAAAKTINEKTGVKTVLSYGTGENMIMYLANMKGLSMYDKTEPKFGFPDASIPTEYFQMFTDAINEGYYVSPEIFVERTPTIMEQKPIVDKTAWNDFLGSNQIVALDKAAGRDLELAMLPRFPDDKTGGYLMPAMYFTISTNSAYKEECAKVIDFFTNSLEANKILNAERGIPASSKIAAELKGSQTAAVQKSFDFISRVEENSFSVNPLNPQGTTEVTDLLNKLIEQVSYKQKPAKEAGEEFFVKGNEILAKAAQQ